MATVAVFVAVLAFMSWAVYLGALASIQAACPDINYPGGSVNANGPINWTMMNLGRGEECDSCLRYWWFLMSIEFFLVVLVMIAGMTHKIHSMRIALTGLAAVCMLLFIQASDVSLTMFLTIPPNTHHGYLYYRLRTWVAGCILVAGFDGFLILALGITNDYELKRREAVEIAVAEHAAHKAQAAQA